MGRGLRLGRILLFLPLFIPVAGEAASTFVLDLGLYGDNLAQRFSTAEGYGNQVSTLSGMLRFRPSVPVASSVSFEPSLGLLVPWRNGADGFAKTLTSWLGLDFALGTAGFKWRFGTALQWKLLMTKSQAVELNNATSTSIFYLPGGTASAFLFLVETGIEVQIAKGVSLGAEAWFSEVASRARRRIHGALYMGITL